MTPDKIIAVAKEYRERFKDFAPAHSKDGGTKFEHIIWMLDEIPKLDADKGNRWLGFIQGFFWTTGVFTIDQMRDHNRNENES